ncbi:hypothetical protein PS619_02004 [Pseudomonas fluorescens]|nr:hypothetical protein PS619_02004 [Pseudomonas fluorescens]
MALQQKINEVLQRVNWLGLKQSLNETGNAVIPALLDDRQCQQLAALYQERALGHFFHWRLVPLKDPRRPKTPQPAVISSDVVDVTSGLVSTRGSLPDESMNPTTHS